MNAANTLAVALALSGTTDVPLREVEPIKPKPLTEADITYDKNGRRNLTKVYESAAGSYLTNPRNLVRRKLSGRQRKRMFKQIQKEIEQVNKNASTNTNITS
jgi:hypothetical protein